MRAKKWIIGVVVLALLLSALFISVSANNDPSFYFELNVDGQDTVTVHTGDVITVSLYLYRTDADTLYTMYAMQDEILYDTSYFELVKGSISHAPEIKSTDIGFGDGLRKVYMNFLSFNGGVQWQPKVCVGTFQLRVIGNSGSSVICNENCLVSYKDGTGSFDCSSNILTVIVNDKETNVYDIDGDGIVSESDVTMLMSILVGNTYSETTYDFDNDGELTIYDCVLLIQQIQ